MAVNVPLVLENAEGSIQHIDKCEVEIAERIALYSKVKYKSENVKGQ